MRGRAAAPTPRVDSNEPTNEVQARASNLMVAASAARPLRQCHRGRRSHTGLSRRRLLWQRRCEAREPRIPQRPEPPGLTQNPAFQPGPAVSPGKLSAKFSAEPCTRQLLGNSTGSSTAGETTEPVHGVAHRFSARPLEGDTRVDGNSFLPFFFRQSQCVRTMH